MDLDQYLEIMNANYWAYLNPPAKHLQKAEMQDLIDETVFFTSFPIKTHLEAWKMQKDQNKCIFTRQIPIFARILTSDQLKLILNMKKA